MTPLEGAQRLKRRKWAVIPVPFRSKNPGRKGWEQERIAEADLPNHFNGEPMNLGVLTGDPSGWMVDVDLDHPRCLELADEYLPPTPCMFGRASKRCSHRLYSVTGPVKTRQVKSRSAGMLVELRSTGGQTVFPPSVHESGEPIEWEDERAEPAMVDPQQLRAAVEALGNAVKVELGERAAPRQRKPREAKAAKEADQVVPRAATSEEAVKQCVAAMRRMKMTDHHDGSGRLFAAACRAVEHDLSDTDALAAIRAFAAQQPFPRDWRDEQVLKRVRDAEQRCTRGAAFDRAVPVALGTHDPVTGRLVLSPRKTLPTAEAFVREFHTHDDGRTIYGYGGAFWVWRDNRFVEVEEETLRQCLQGWLHRAMRYIENPQTGEVRLIDFDSNSASINSALDALRAHIHLAASLTPPCWRDETRIARPDPRYLLAFPSGTLDLANNVILAPTPALFNTSAIDFDYVPRPEPPERWIAFLEQLWKDDLQSVELLQEWMGYCLVADTSLQKMLLLVGPRRSGKGTIARILRCLVGHGNVVGPTTSSLAGTFGLQPLIGKSLAIVSDARFTGESIGIVTERLLCISGEDTLTIDRKFLGSVTMKLATRFMFISNELPRMNDASGALAGRFVILRLTESFYGREDAALTETLKAELPGILLWAIDGLKRLRARGRFVQPASVADAVRELEDLASPVGAFVRDCCVVGAGHRVWVDDLYHAWKHWCERDGRTIVTNKQTFGRDLSAAVAGVTRRRGAMDQPFYAGVGLKDVQQP